MNEVGTSIRGDGEEGRKRDSTREVEWLSYQWLFCAAESSTESAVFR